VIMKQGRRRGSRYRGASWAASSVAALVALVLAAAVASAAAWTLSVRPAHPKVPGTLTVVVTGPGPAPSLTLKTPELTYHDRMRRVGPGTWQAKPPLAGPGLMTVEAVVGHRVVASTSVAVGESSGATVSRLIGGIILIGAFLFTWARARRYQ
jgi:hypothetical protein